ncbi:MAG: Ig-like domain-containing protein [Deltaproteobacteria bacterium]|nr:Ig-like domain-containing protein [Deltaproteobacteria bacterium]
MASANIPDGATGVAVDSPITVTFSEAMNAATFTDQTFQVVGPTGQVAGAISYSGTTATFKPTQSLQYFTNYTVTLTTAVKDPAGNPLAQNYTFGFRTMVAPATGMAGGGGHSVMVLSDGTVWAWGYNSNGQVGDGTTTDRNAPVPVAGLTGMESVASGGTHTLAIRQSDGAVFAWGWNAYGQCGNGTTADQIKPVQVNILTGVGVVAGGLYHSLALLDDGTVWAWGHNGFGQLGDGTTTQRTTPVQVLGQGGIGYLTNIVAIATQGTHSLALRDDGTVWAWGYNGEGQLGDGTVTQRLTPVQVTGLVGVAEISAGLNHSLARLNDGALRAWGANSVGQLGDGSTTKRLVPIAVSGLGPAVDIAAGANFSMAVLNDKTVRAWGYNASAQLGDGTFVNRLTPVPVGGLTGIQGVAAGQSHAFARQANGTLVGWGYNFYGQVGDASATFAAYTPHQVGAFVGAKAIASGGKHALLVDGNGDVYAWGNNSSGQLGDGTTEHHHTPQPIGLTNAKAVAAGTAFSVALMNDSTVRVWGINSSGELGLGAAGGNELLERPDRLDLGVG